MAKTTSRRSRRSSRRSRTKVFDERSAQIEKDRDAMFQGMPEHDSFVEWQHPRRLPTPPADPNAPQDEKKGK